MGGPSDLPTGQQRYWLMGFKIEALRKGKQVLALCFILRLSFIFSLALLLCTPTRRVNRFVTEGVPFQCFTHLFYPKQINQSWVVSRAGKTLATWLASYETVLKAISSCTILQSPEHYQSGRGGSPISHTSSSNSFRTTAETVRGISYIPPPQESRSRRPRPRGTTRPSYPTTPTTCALYLTTPDQEDVKGTSF